ncbi:MAG: hypothetical protein ACLT4Y_11230 [Bifidobacterium breve]
MRPSPRRPLLAASLVAPLAFSADDDRVAISRSTDAALGTRSVNFCEEPGPLFRGDRRHHDPRRPIVRGLHQGPARSSPPVDTDAKA